MCFTICLFITGSPDLDGYRYRYRAYIDPARPTKGPETQIRSHRVTLASNHRLP
jgi:hypothetical protein